MSPPLIELQRVSRRYEAGDEGETFALREVDLVIEAGEMVALMGASGSGKSTLLNILGCLDQLSSGSYRFDGREIGSLSPNELAALRRDHVGFIFQRYHLLPRLSVLANVETPAIYAGVGETARQARAKALLERLGLGNRLDRLPNQLSGGQQQRVSVARALMNGGDVILADEPTGALDTKTGRELMTLLAELNREGHTLIIATHDPQVAAYAHRIIDLTDGRIVSDRSVTEGAETQGDVRGAVYEAAPLSERNVRSPNQTVSPLLSWPQLVEAGRMALIALRAHRLRTGLTLLGVVIGIVSVVMMVAVGEAAQRRMNEELKGIPENYLEIFPGKFQGDPDVGSVRSLTRHDAETLRVQSFVHSVSPITSVASSIQFASQRGLATVNGVSDAYFESSGFKLLIGPGFDENDVRQSRQVAVVDVNIMKRFFAGQNPVGKIIKVGSMPAIIVGVSAKNPSMESVTEQARAVIYMPHTTVAARLTGRAHMDLIIMRFRAGLPMQSVVTAVEDLLTRRHHGGDFWIFNAEERVRSARVLTDSMAALLGAIGAVSLIVGGIGVMNIMLVSVSERAREIGIRAAVGARVSDVQAQFLTEAVVVCLIGGAIGVAICFGATIFADRFLPDDWRLSLSTSALSVATLSSVLTGVVFGYVPARNAARLDPVEALARD